MEKYIYPRVKVDTVLLKGGRGHHIEDTWRVTLETYLRKRRGKKYYFQKHWKETFCPAHELCAASIADGVNRFHEDVYRSLILSHIDPRIVFPLYDPPLPAFEVDSDLRTEAQRLLDINIFTNAKF